MLPNFTLVICFPKWSISTEATRSTGKLQDKIKTSEKQPANIQNSVFQAHKCTLTMKNLVRSICYRVETMKIYINHKAGWTAVADPTFSHVPPSSLEVIPPVRERERERHHTLSCDTAISPQGVTENVQIRREGRKSNLSPRCVSSTPFLSFHVVCNLAHLEFQPTK